MERQRPAPLFVAAATCGDAVLGCGDTIARHRGSIVAAVFGPPRRDDARALAHLGARAVWLERAERKGAAGVEEIAQAVGRAFDTSGARVGVLPLGLRDQRLRAAHDGCLLAALRRPDARWLAFEDAGGRLNRASLSRRLRTLARGGVKAAPLRRVPGGDLKLRAMACYTLKLAFMDALVCEGLWTLGLP